MRSANDEQGDQADRSGELANDLAALKGQIAEMREKPWYRQASAVIAALALSFSVVSLWLSQSQSQAEAKTALRAEFRATLSQLERLRADATYRARDIEDPLERQRYLATIRSRMSVLLVNATDLESKIPDSQLTSAELSTLGNLFRGEDFGTARRLLDAAASNANTAVERALATKDLGLNSFEQGKSQDGRSHFRDAIEAIQESRDPIVRLQLAWIHESWGETEAGLGDPAQAREHFQYALAEYTQLKAVNSEVPAHVERIKKLLAELPDGHERTERP